MKPIKISILTPSYNQAAFIGNTIESVQRQGYPQVEHIVIDGGSIDGTVEILGKHPHLRWVSERDRGQADALNKGLRMSSGDVIGWINSDDYYCENVFPQVARLFENEGTQWVTGGVARCIDDGTPVPPRTVTPTTYDSLLRNPHSTSQPATFFRKELVNNAGGWDERFHMVMDLDLWIRMAKYAAPVMVNEPWAVFRHHTGQKTNGGNYLRQAHEINRILKREHAPMFHRYWLFSRSHILYLKYCATSVLARVRLIDRRKVDIPLGSSVWTEAKG